MLSDTGKSIVSHESGKENKLKNPGEYIRSVAGVLDQLPMSAVEGVIRRLFQAYEQGRTVYIFGNGGSAALASHSACDLGKGTGFHNKKRFRVLSLTDNVALITAWGNDTCYENIFAAQLEPLIQAGDVALAISGSGNSPNVLRGLAAARENGASTVGLTGFQGGKMRALCDLCVIVPSDNMQVIEDCHLSVMHAVFLALRQCIMDLSVPQARVASSHL